MLDIVTYPNDILKKPTKKVDKVDKEIKSIIKEMFQTMYKNDGIGLAANQVNLPFSLMIIDTTPRKEEIVPIKEVFINPVITESSGEITYKEGCLSFPGLQIEVKRFSFIKIKAINENEEEIEKELTGLNAVVFQHEIDHLNGITFLDRIKGIKKRLAVEKYKKLIKKD